ncbi:MAG: Tim44/TimA family putative adaptor protein [Rickettsiales bacterium]
MNNAVPYADIIILALIAGFILLRLRSVLGQNTGDDNMDAFKKSMRTQAEQEPIIKLGDHNPKAKTKEEPEPDHYLKDVTDLSVTSGLKAIKEKDAEFSATQFMQGAKMAFEMVFDGFAKGDKAPLKMLLSDELYQQFDAEIEARNKSEDKTETTLVSVNAKDITKAELDKNNARITVRFLSEQITVVRDKDGKIIDGDPSEVSEADDEWVFERNVTSKNPNWTIVDT